MPSGKLLQAELSSAAEAARVLFKELGWKSGGLAAAAHEIVAEARKLRAEGARLALDNDSLRAEVERLRVLPGFKVYPGLYEGRSE